MPQDNKTMQFIFRADSIWDCRWAKSGASGERLSLAVETGKAEAAQGTLVEEKGAEKAGELKLVKAVPSGKGISPAVETGKAEAAPGMLVEEKGAEKASDAPCPWGSTGMVGDPAFSDGLAMPAVRLLGGVLRGTWQVKGTNAGVS